MIKEIKQNIWGKKCYLICDFCGKEFTRKYALIKNNKNHYCNRNCMGKAMRGREISLETREKLRVLNIGENNPMFGKKHSEEIKKIIGDAERGAKNHNWKNGRRIQNQQGYIGIKTPNHPCRDINGYVMEHRLIMEKHLNRYLKIEEVVHHIDGNPKNNILSNLNLFKNDKEYKKYHYKLRTINEFGRFNNI